MTSLWPKALALLNAQMNCVMVTVTNAEGSTPREEGAQMLVTARGYHGTIGGGTLEWLAMAEAQSLLGKSYSIRTLTKSLGPDLGQCCGGRMTLRLESFTMADIEDVEQHAALSDDVTHLNLWGAGHVGRALVMALAPLPFEITWWDVRDNAFPSAVPENVTCRLGAPQDMDPGLVLVMTHSHALDFDIVDFALRHPHFPQIGLIGSDTKAARFRKRLVEAGHGSDALSRLTSPIGSKSIRSKLPAAIAASVAVQLLQWQEMLKTQEFPAQVAPHYAKAQTRD
ncbi:MAG: xanthine dehydrogenase accessory protein XdhC [Aestuariivirga sp.]